MKIKHKGSATITDLLKKKNYNRETALGLLKIQIKTIATLNATNALDLEGEIAWIHLV